MTAPALILPQLQVPEIRLPEGPLTGAEAFEGVRRGLLEGLLGSEDSGWRRARDKLIAWAGFSNAMEDEILDSIFGDHATINLFSAPTYLALVTVAVAEGDTGSTITEANYTGYARKSIAAADMGASSGGTKSNTAQQQFANATGGSSTIIGWAQCSASTAGKVGLFGTSTSTVISATQTPATIAVGALSGSLD